MLRKLAAAVVLVGLCLPYACDSRAITSVWETVPDVAMFGVPVLAAVFYGALRLLPPVTRGVDRAGPALFMSLRGLYVLLAAAYLVGAIRQTATATERLGVALALLVTGVALVWQRGKGTTAQRVPLVLLAILGLPIVDVLVLTELELQTGGWLVTAGWILAVLEEGRLLHAMPRV